MNPIQLVLYISHTSWKLSDTNRKIRFNKSISGGNNPDGNTFNSTMILEEFSTFTHNIAEQKVQGRVLETLAGVCDGRSISVSSGTYTLGNVSAEQQLTSGSSWVDITGSEIVINLHLVQNIVIYKLEVYTRWGPTADGISIHQL